ncbi:hypothetical protein MRB53_041254 [Persea americana]|nr:hypothetical protein MRB53_041254 [Persea americana]
MLSISRTHTFNRYSQKNQEPRKDVSRSCNGNANSIKRHHSHLHCLELYADLIGSPSIMAIVPDDSPIRRHFPLSGDIVSMLISLIALPTIAIFIVARWPKEGMRWTVATFLCLLQVFLGSHTEYLANVSFSRISYVLDTEVCIIGMRRFALMPMLGVETAAQLYLTLRFLQPLLRVHQDGSGLLSPLRKIVIRTSIGCAVTMLLDVAVKVSLTLFNGEPTFFAASILFWITKPGLPHDYLTNGEQELGVGFEGSVTDSVVTSSELAEAGRLNFVKRVMSFPNAYETKIPRTQSIDPKS